MAGADRETLVDVIRNSVGSEPELVDVSIYRHAKLETDLVVHLHRAETQQSDRACDCGERLASMLRAYGLVEHSVWFEYVGKDEE
jgi:cytosine/adenosine deaminase-related metal-dependent hydrolase